MRESKNLTGYRDDLYNSLIHGQVFFLIISMFHCIYVYAVYDGGSKAIHHLGSAFENSPLYNQRNYYPQYVLCVSAEAWLNAAHNI